MDIDKQLLPCSHIIIKSCYHGLLRPYPVTNSRLVRMYYNKKLLLWSRTYHNRCPGGEHAMYSRGIRLHKIAFNDRILHGVERCGR